MMRHKPQLFTSRLGHIEKISSKVYLKRFDLVEPREMHFTAGQTVMLRVADGVNRSMSIASPPGETASITVAHDVSPMGPYSKWTISAKVGDEMKFMGPLGLFILDPSSRRNKVFVATGTGIAPFRSILLDVFSASRASPVPYNIFLYWGLRFEEDIFWREEFEALSRANPTFSFRLILSRPAPTWAGLTGHVTEHILENEKKLGENDYYLCGNKSMIEDMKEILLMRNVPKEQIKTELFY